MLTLEAPSYGTADTDAPPAREAGAGLAELARSAGPADRYAALSAIAQAGTDADDEETLLDDAAACVARAVGATHFGAALPRSGGEAILFRVGETGAYRDGRGTTVRELSALNERSAVAHAIRRRQAVVFADRLADGRFDDLALAESKLAAGVLVPLPSARQCLGALGVFSPEARVFSREDVLYVETAAHLLSAGLARRRAEECLRRQQQLAAATVDALDSLVISLNPAGRIERCNRACRETTGFRESELRDRTFGSAFLLPEDLPAVQQGLARVRRGGATERIETFLLTKHGERRRVAWSFGAVLDESGGMQGVTCNGVDVTTSFELRGRLTRAEAAAEEARRTIRELQEGRSPPREAAGPEPDPALDAARQAAFAGAERRRHGRRAYPYLQLVAPTTDGRLPAISRFREVRCKDIARGGFCFYLPQPPLDDEWVAAFGAYPRQVFLVSRIVHVTQVQWEDELMYAVGCRYVRRAAP